MTTIKQSRVAQIQALAISSGSHDAFEQGACVMELVSWVAGEPWSDHPVCACPVITEFLVSWNDSLLSDADRERLLKPLIPSVVGTRSTPAVAQRRAVMAADWLIRVHTPAWLRLAKLETQAKMLEALPEITDFAQCPSLMPVLQTVRNDTSMAWRLACDAQWAAVGVAAWDASLSVIRDAEWAAAGSAARSAATSVKGSEAVAVAVSEARDAALNAARSAEWDAIKPTVAILQTSAVDLVRRMIEVKP
jgi:hypothetical protein